jgi:hypothetical protein
MRDIVADSISENVVQRICLRDVLALLAYHRNKLAFIVQSRHFLRHGRDFDGVCRACARFVLPFR